MKARIPINRNQRRWIEAGAKEQVEVERHEMTRRVFKVFIYALNTEFGFGAKRCKRLVDAVNGIFTETDKDELWRRLDHHVIDYMKIPFEREKTDINGKLKPMKERK